MEGRHKDTNGERAENGADLHEPFPGERRGCDGAEVRHDRIQVQCERDGERHRPWRGDIGTGAEADGSGQEQCGEQSCGMAL